MRSAPDLLLSPRRVRGHPGKIDAAAACFGLHLSVIMSPEATTSAHPDKAGAPWRSVPCFAVFGGGMTEA